MRLRTSVKLMALVLLGVFTSLVTSSILAQVQKPKKRPAPQNRLRQSSALPARSAPRGSVVKRSEVRVDRNDLPVPPGMPIRKSDSSFALAHFRVPDMEVTTEGRLVTIAARAYIMDKRQNSEYMWGLRVHKGRRLGNVVSERPYSHQKFRKLAELEATPTFTEQIQLPPGTYQLQVILYDLPVGFDLSRLKDRKVAQNYEAATKERQVVITE